MMSIVGVRFKTAGKIYTFLTDADSIAVGDPLIVDTSRGCELGFCAEAPRPLREDEAADQFKSVLRAATQDDLDRYRENVVLASEALRECARLVREHGLDMQLLEANYTFDNKKLIFYFTSEARVDFRGLVRDLASLFRTRIELRQVGVRDEAKALGGIGPCGRELCCTRFLKDFGVVSIKMAKDQGLSLSPGKISGMCGRLMCCLSYEQDFYEERLRELPKLKRLIQTPDGPGKVTAVDPVTNTVRVLIMQPDGSTMLAAYAAEELRRKNTCPCPMKRHVAEETRAEKEGEGGSEETAEETLSRRDHPPQKTAEAPSGYYYPEPDEEGLLRYQEALKNRIENGGRTGRMDRTIPKAQTTSDAIPERDTAQAGDGRQRKSSNKGGYDRRTGKYGGRKTRNRGESGIDGGEDRPPRDPSKHQEGSRPHRRRRRPPKGDGQGAQTEAQ